MKLTLKEAMRRTIELWTELAEKGCFKWQVEHRNKYQVFSGCWLCDYDVQFGGGCNKCPLDNIYGERGCYADELSYVEWEKAETTEDRKKYAALFLEQLKAIKL